jgi:hypothetical protein
MVSSSSSIYRVYSSLSVILQYKDNREIIIVKRIIWSQKNRQVPFSGASFESFESQEPV